MREGNKPQKQAVAIAYAKKRGDAKDGVLEEQDRLYAENKAASNDGRRRQIIE